MAVNFEGLVNLYHFVGLFFLTDVIMPLYENQRMK